MARHRQSYDNLDRLTSETTPQGTISYTYDNAGRRTTMQVAGQQVVNYTFDNPNRVTQITQGTLSTSFGMTMPTGARTDSTV